MEEMDKGDELQQGNTQYGAGGNNPQVQGNIKAVTGGNINFGNQVFGGGNFNLGTQEYPEGMDTTKSFFEIGKLLYDIFGKQIGHNTNPEKTMEQLDKNARYLFAQRDDVEERTRESPNVATRESRLWLEYVKKLEVEVQSIKDEHMRCSNVFSRPVLGKRVGDVIEEITDLNNKRPKLKGKGISNALLERVEPQIVEINSSTDSEPRLQKIFALIEDVGIRKIGIWGMGGIGKTRTLKLLNNRLVESRMFDIVIWVTVSGKGSLRKVQDDIADRLKCTAMEMSDNRLRANIYRCLTGKKFLLLLDDVWEMINLSDVGIPALNQVDGCKVVLTTRSLKVCRQMETNKDVKVETLSEDLAWNLFIVSAGDVAMTSDIKQFAGGIVKECGGLPLAIKVVGSSLRNNNDAVVWRNTLRRLKLPTSSQNEDMEERVFRCLRSSYDMLQDDCKKKLFLYCSLYPEDYEVFINDLVEYCWLEDYIHGIGSIEDARDEGHTMVMNIVEASLLEKCDKEGHVKMHDVVRDFALREAFVFLVRAGMNIKHPLEEKEWLQMQKISYMKSNLCNLLERPNCSTLCTLLLQYNDQLTMIPDSFFEYMRSLSIIDLSWTEIKSLPSSLWNLVNLRGLYLKDCIYLEELPSQVGALRQLEVLHLGGTTAIRYLPREVGELTRLKRLIVGFQYRNCSQNDGDGEDDDDEDTKDRKRRENGEEWNMKLRVPTGIIPKLTYLEELSLYVSFVNSGRFCVEKEQWDDESMEVVVDEVSRLEHLTYLDAYFPKVKCLEHFLRPKGKVVKATSWLRRFRFRVGTEICNRWFVDREGQEWERCLVYNGGLGMSHAAAIMETLAHSSLFHLQDRTARKLSELGLANMNELKECRVESCEKMEILFDGDEQRQTCALLPILETLRIHDLPELRSLCNGPLLPGSLSKLQHLHLISCKNLKKVFQLGIIRQLCSLETLEVVFCKKMEEIIEIEEEEDMSVGSHSHNVTSYNNDRVILPNIKKILLWSLPELVSICRGFSNFELPSLVTIGISGCPKLKSLSFLSNGTDIVAPALREIEGSSSWWEALEWEDNDIKQRLQLFFSEWKW